MSEIEAAAVEFVRLRLEASRLKKERNALHCEAGGTTVFGGPSPRCFEDPGIKDSRSDWCPSCQKSQPIHEQYRKTIRMRQSAMCRLVRLAKNKLFIKFSIIPGVVLVNGKEYRYPEDFPINLPANVVLLPDKENP